MPESIVVIGSPGTGKTESLTRVAKRWYRQGAAPEEVAYLTFTKDAAFEASRRMADEESSAENLEKMFPHFRTIHSLTYRGLRGERPGVRVFTPQDFRKFAKMIGHETGVGKSNEWEDLSFAYARTQPNRRPLLDRVLSAFAATRITARTLDDLKAARDNFSSAGIRVGGFIKRNPYRELVESYEKYKAKEGLVDFADMLEFGLTTMRPLTEVKHMVIDEAQDLSALLNSVVDRLFQDAQHQIWGGDDDQSLYEWAGADAKLFINRSRRSMRRILLRQSHRFGARIVEFAGKIIRRAKGRLAKEIWGLEGKDHVVRMTTQFKPSTGPMLVLHRHVRGCQQIAEAHRLEACPFRNERGWDPLGDRNRVEAFEALWDLTAGNSIMPGAVSRMVDELVPTRSPENVRFLNDGGRELLQDMVGKGPLGFKELSELKALTEEGLVALRSRQYSSLRQCRGDLEYFARLRFKGHSLSGVNVPRITTIHGSKGREAEKVVLFSETGVRCFENPDGEHRLAYVGSTRTRGELEICSERLLKGRKVRYDYPVDE